MATITPKQHPLPTLQPRRSAQVPRHVARRLNNPETTVAKVVERFLEGTKGDPWAGKLFAALSRVLRVEEAAVPLGVGIREVAWCAAGFGAGPEEGGCVGEFVADGAAVVPVGVALVCISGMHACMGGEERGKREGG